MFTGKDFENMGRAVASEYVGNNVALNDSITKLSEHYGLNSEQIARVVEQANVETYLTLNKNTEDKYIEFDPADTVKVASALNFKLEKDAAIMSDYDRFTSSEDWQFLSALDEDELAIIEKSKTGLMKRAAKTIDKAIKSRLEEIDESFSRDSESLYKLVKQASLELGEFGTIKQAMISAVPGKVTNLIIDAYKDKLKKEAATINYEDIETPNGPLNFDHPIIKKLIKLSVLKSEYIDLIKFQGEVEKTSMISPRPFKDLFHHVMGAGGASFDIVRKTIKSVASTALRAPSLIVGGVALGTGIAVGKAKGRSESSKANIRINQEYVERAKNLKPL